MPARWQDYAMEITKQQLRQKLLSLRPHNSLGLSNQLAKLISQIRPQTLASYSPLAGEPDVAEFNEMVSSDVNLVFPKVLAETLVFCRGPLVAGKYGISEPVGEKVEEIDLLIMPGLAVDERGNRLGRGKGFYDRYLEGKSLTRYVVVFDEEVLASIPTDSWDVPVDGYVTPTRVVNF